MIRPEFNPARLPGEVFKTYRNRCRAVNKAVKLHLKGRLRFKSSEPVVLPVVGVDSQVDRAVIEGHYRNPQILLLPAPRLPWPHGPRTVKPVPKEVRFAVTKGASYTTTPYIDGTKRCCRRLLREFRAQ